MKNPEWRPRDSPPKPGIGLAKDALLCYVDDSVKWRWKTPEIDGSRYEPLEHAHLLAALLPRAIEKFEKNLMVYINFSDDPRSKSPLSWKIAIPRTLSEAVETLEAP
ncbi:MAG: hypothetical protein KF805_12585 [Phycisphaeraceae bacterium]|nr:hypothetical protein [Phycisphaeraceae bacterium]